MSDDEKDYGDDGSDDEKDYGDDDAFGKEYAGESRTKEGEFGRLGQATYGGILEETVMEGKRGKMDPFISEIYKLIPGDDERKKIKDVIDDLESRGKLPFKMFKNAKAVLSAIKYINGKESIDTISKRYNISKFDIIRYKNLIK